MAYDWWPDASALLLANLVEGRHRLYRFDLATGDLTPIEHPDGQVSAGHVRPDGARLAPLGQRRRARRASWTTGATRCFAPRVRSPPRDVRTSRSGSTTSTVSRSTGSTPRRKVTGPFPVLVRPHGGPTWLDEDRWSPEAQAYVDAGFAVAMINYRGSTGYGAEWRDSLTGDIGGPELEDLNAGLEWLVQHGIADPARAVVGGWSWGGYLTLMELGKHPDLWLCGVAGSPSGTTSCRTTTCRRTCRPTIGRCSAGPDEVPALMLDRNPINFADDVRVPVLFVIGENDSRCPFRQAMAYVDKLAARDHPHEVYLFGTGHGSYDTEEDVRQVGTILAFLAKHVLASRSRPASRDGPWRRARPVLGWPYAHPAAIVPHRDRVPARVPDLARGHGDAAIVSGSGFDRTKPEVEDVEELDVFLVCHECGTELHVTRLGELQVPRHCGEPMQVVRRPAVG